MSTDEIHERHKEDRFIEVCREKAKTGDVIGAIRDLRDGLNVDLRTAKDIIENASRK